MRIDERRVFIFTFPYESSELTIPVKADSREEAIGLLQNFLSHIQTDLAMEQPRVATLGATPVQGQTNASVGVVPPEVLEMRMDTLLTDLGAVGQSAKAKALTVKKWTGYELTEDNYAKIIGELELIKSGKKEIK